MANVHVPFRLLQLPRLVIRQVLREIALSEVLLISMLSTNAANHVRDARIRFESMGVLVDNHDIVFEMKLRDSRDSPTFWTMANSFHERVPRDAVPFDLAINGVYVRCAHYQTSEDNLLTVFVNPYVMNLPDILTHMSHIFHAPIVNSIHLISNDFRRHGVWQWFPSCEHAIITGKASAETLERFFANVRISRSFSLHGHCPAMEAFFGEVAHLNELVLRPAKWFCSQHLSAVKCELLDVQDTALTDQCLNLKISHWRTGPYSRQPFTLRVTHTTPFNRNDISSGTWRPAKKLTVPAFKYPNLELVGDRPYFLTETRLDGASYVAVVSKSYAFISLNIQCE